jgi:hypothetical protein
VVYTTSLPDGGVAANAGLVLPDGGAVPPGFFSVEVFCNGANFFVAADGTYYSPAESGSALGTAPSPSAGCDALCSAIQPGFAAGTPNEAPPPATCELTTDGGVLCTYTTKDTCTSGCGTFDPGQT